MNQWTTPSKLAVATGLLLCNFGGTLHTCSRWFGALTSMTRPASPFPLTCLRWFALSSALQLSFVHVPLITSQCAPTLRLSIVVTTLLHVDGLHQNASTASSGIILSACLLASSWRQTCSFGQSGWPWTPILLPMTSPGSSQHLPHLIIPGFFSPIPWLLPVISFSYPPSFLERFGAFS